MKNKLTEPVNFIIYKHTNLINGKVYIGETIQDVKDRWKNGKAYKSCTHFNNAIEKYGWDNFSHEILEKGFGLDKDIGEREQYWINYYDACNPDKGYNITSGGYVNLSNKALPAALKWMEEHPQFGLERVAVMHEWQKTHPEEHLRINQENVKKAIESRKIKVRCTETGIIYESASEAARHIPKTSQSKICMACRGQRETSGGFHWEYYIENNNIVKKEKNNMNFIEIPKKCPCCNQLLIKRNNNSSIYLICENPTCSAKQLAKFNHFVSKACMNIDGLSENTLEVLINNGFLHKFADIYQLSSVKDELIKLERFGKTKVDNLLNAIEDSRHVKLENYINALGIPNIGKSASKAISKYCNGNINTFIKLFRTNFDFSQLEDFGQTMNKAIYEYFSPKNNSFELASNLIQELDFIKEEVFVVDANDFINGKTFVVTGKFNTMPRNELEKIITNHGGKLSGSVSKKTDYLLTNDGESGSTKAEKAKSLNIPIMSEEEFLSKIN